MFSNLVVAPKHVTRKPLVKNTSNDHRSIRVRNGVRSISVCARESFGARDAFALKKPR